MDGSPLAEPLAPHIQPAYYAAIITAEAIGLSGTTQAVEISIDDDTIAGYAFYEGGCLVRAILINSQAFLQGETTRGSVHVNLAIDSNPLMMTIKRLSIGYRIQPISYHAHANQNFDLLDTRMILLA